MKTAYSVYKNSLILFCLVIKIAIHKCLCYKQ